MANAISYIKNVGKSVTYTSFKVLKDMNPIVQDFNETNGETISEMYKSIRDLKKTVRRIPKSVMETEYGKFGKTWLNNALDDIKTGKFYNKERIDKYEEQAAANFAGIDNFDFGSDDDFGSFGDLDSFSNDEPDTNEMMDIVGEKASNAVSTAMARSADYIVESNNQFNKNMLNRVNVIYSGLQSSLSTINENIGKMVQLTNEGALTHFENSSNFYNEVTRMDQERNQYLKEILENLKTLNAPSKSQETKYKKNTYSDLISSEGVLDLSQYKDVIKKNIKDKSGMGGAIDMLNMMTEMGMLNTLASSPISGVLEMIIAGAVPGNIKKSMENLNKSLSGMMGNALMGIKNKSRKEGGIWDTILDIFGVNTSIDTKLDPSKYEKGKIPFDGVTKKAIVEVIPTYLSKILSALTNTPENRFNYDSGEFVTVETLRKEFKDLYKDSVNRAAYELDSIVKSNKNKLSFRDDEDRMKQFEDDWEAIKEYMYRNQRNFNTRDKSLRGNTFGLKGGAASDINVRLLQEILDGNPEMLTYADKMFKERDTYNRRIAEAQNNSSYTALFNNSISSDDNTSGRLPSVALNANQSIISELVDIHKELSYIRLYGIGNTSGGRPSFDSFTIPVTRTGNENVYNRNAEQNQTYESLTDEELDSQVSQIITSERDQQSGTEESKSFSQRMNEASGLSAKISVLVKSASELAKKPAEFVVSVLDKADQRLYDLIYGPKNDTKGDKSFVGRMFNGLENIFNKFSDFVTDSIIEPLKGKFTKENIKSAAQKFFGIFGIDLDDTIAKTKEMLFGKKGENGRREGGIFGDFINGFKDEFKSAFKWVKNLFSETGEWFGATSKKNERGKAKEDENDLWDQLSKSYMEDAKNILKNNASSMTEAATGLKRVENTGLAILSEGEMVIPPDMNPYNISKRKRNEKRVKDNIKNGIDSIFEYAEGTKDATSGKKLSEEDQKKYDEYVKLANEAKANKQSFTREDYERTPLGTRIFDEFKKLIDAIRETTENFKPSDDERDKFKDNITNFIGKFKEYGSTMAAGGTIGAGVSILTGAIGGPLVGAAVGAGLGLLKKSEKVQEMLFGKLKDGEREGGIIPKDITNNINKYFPDMSKGATVGGILAAMPFVPGGPVAGIIIGSSIGFAKNNEKIQTALFGEIGKDGKRDGTGLLKKTPQQFQDKVQSLLPKMGLGALAGLVAGPFGVTTNLILGSALGFATDTNKFKDLVFGEVVDGKRRGGLLSEIVNPVKDFFQDMFGEFKEFFGKKILKPLDIFIDPFKKRIKDIGDSIMEKITDRFKKHIWEPIDQFLKDKIIDPIGKFLGGTIKALMRPVKAVVSAPFRALGFIGDRWRRKDVSTGRADYMSAAERNEYRKTHNMETEGNQYYETDEILANADSESLNLATDTLSQIKGSAKKNIRKLTKTSYNTIYDTFYDDKNLRNDKHFTRTALRMVRSGSYSQAEEFVKNANIPEESKKKLLKVIQTEGKKLETVNSMQSNMGETSEKIADTLNKAGFNFTAEDIAGLANGEKSAIDKYNLFIKEQKVREKEEKAKNKEKQPPTEEKEAERHEEILNPVKEIRDDIKKLLDQLLKKDINIKSDQYKDELQEELSSDTDKNINKVRSFNYNTRRKAKNIKNAIFNRNKQGQPTVVSEDEIIANVDDVPEAATGGISGDRDGVKKTNSFLKFFTDMAKNIRKMAGTISAIALKDDIDIENIDHEKADSDSYFSKIKNKLKKATNYVTQFVNGHPLVLRKDKNGQLIPDSSNAENKDTMDMINEENETQKGILGALTGLPNTLGGLFSKLFGNKEEEKKSIFEKIWDFFTGDGSNGISLLSILLKGLPLALTIAGITGKLDNIASKFGFGSNNSNQNITITTESGEVKHVQLDENGNPLKNENGEYILTDGTTASGNSTLNTTNAVSKMDLQERIKYNTARGTVTTSGSIIGNALKNNSLTKTVTNAIKNGKSTGKVYEEGAGVLKNTANILSDNATLVHVTNAIGDITTKWAKAISKIPILSKFSSKIDDLGLALAEFSVDFLPKAGAKLAKVASAIGKVSIVLTAAFAIADFTTGWQDASTTLKIREEDVTVPHRIVCGLLRTVKNLIPVIGTFIPDTTLTDFFINYVASWFNMDVSELKAKRSLAEEELQKYKEDNNITEDLSWAEYNKDIKGNYTWTEKIGNTFSSIKENIQSKGGIGKAASAYVLDTANKVSNKVSQAGHWVGDKVSTATSWVGDKVSKAGHWVGDKASKAGQWVSEKATGLATGVKENVINPVMDAVKEKLEVPKDLGKYAYEVVKDYFKELISGKTENSEALLIDKDDPYGSYKQIIYNTIKILGMPVSNIVQAGRFVWDEGIKPFVEGVKQVGTGIGTMTKSLFKKAWDGHFIQAISNTDGDVKSDNKAIEFISKGLNGVVKTQLAIPGLLTTAVGFVVRNFDNILNSIKAIGSGIGSTVSNQFKNAWNGDIQKAFDTSDSNVNGDNKFVNSISKALNNTVKIPLAIPTLLTSGIGFVVRNFGKVVEGFKTVGSGVSSMVTDAMSKAMNGKNPLQEIYTDKHDAKTGNGLVDMASKALNNTVKMPLSIVALLTTGVRFVGDKVVGFFNGIKEAGTLSSQDEQILEKSKQGLINPFSKEYWSITSSKTGVAGWFNTYISLMKKTFNMPIALISFIAQEIKKLPDAITKLIEKGTNWLTDIFNIDNSETGRGSGLPVGRGSNIESADNTFVSQIDPKYKNRKFNISGDTESQTIGDTGCAPAAATMVINSTAGINKTTMEQASRNALGYKVHNDGVNATYFNDEFARHGMNAKYIASNNPQIRKQEIMNQLVSDNKVVLMGQDVSNTSKSHSPFGPNAHYVVANGLSKDGKYIYINDPESTKANIKYRTDKVIGSSQLGIAASVARGTKTNKSKVRNITNFIKGLNGRGTLPGADVAEKCWNFLKSNGFTDEAAAGVLGNFQQESSMKPDNIQGHGKGPAAGLFQMEKYKDYSTRWGEMAQLAESRGKDWTDLESQLLFLLQDAPGQWKSFTGQKKGTGTYQSQYADENGRHWYKNGEWAWWPDKMTFDEFKAITDIELATEVFERVFERASHPMMEKRIQYAKEYYNKFSGKYVPVTTTYVDSATTTGTNEIVSTGSDNSPLGKLFTEFTNIAKAYDIPGVGDTSNTTTSDNSSGISNTTVQSADGNVSSNPEHAKLQKALVEKMYSVQGKLFYAQDNAKYPGSRNPEDGSGDCSSTVQWAYKNILGVDPGSWTGAQRDDSDTYTVATSTQDESLLQLGDLLLKDGHVEMYAGNGKMIGHGSGYGPKVKDLDQTPGKYNLVRRWVGFKGSGSGLLKNNFVGRGSEAPAYNSALKHIEQNKFTSLLPQGFENNEIDDNKVSIMQYNSNGKLSNNKISKVNVPISTPTVGRGSQVAVESKSRSNDDMIKIIKSIVQLLIKVVTNTDQLNNIVKLLGDYMTAIGSSDGTEQSKQATVLAKQNLINAMQSSNSKGGPSADLLVLIENTERIARE